MGGAGYAVFGRVIEGMDVVDKIVAVQTGNRGPHQNVPVTPVVIRKARVEGAASSKPADTKATETKPADAKATEPKREEIERPEPAKPVSQPRPRG